MELKKIHVILTGWGPSAESRASVFAFCQSSNEVILCHWVNIMSLGHDTEAIFCDKKLAWWLYYNLALDPIWF